MFSLLGLNLHLDASHSLKYFAVAGIQIVQHQRVF